MARARHHYLRLAEKRRPAYLGPLADDDLLLLRSDLDAIGADCAVLTSDLHSRGLPNRPPDDHLLPPHYFKRDERTRRLPNPAEYAWKRTLFLGAKFGPPLGAVAGGMLQDLGGFEWGLLVGLTGSLGLWAALLLGGFNPFYRPLRYALVRPFNQDQFAKPLKRFVLRNIGLRCHGLTLSDRHFQPHRVMWWLHGNLAGIAAALAGVAALPVIAAALFSPWLRQSVRIATVLKPSGFRDLFRLFRKVRLQSTRHLLCGGQCFNIRTVDAAWKYAMQAIVHESDFVIVDLSYVKAGSQWEIELLELRNRVRSCIAVCQVGHGDALERYAHLFPQVQMYDERGRLSEADSFVDDIRAAVARRAPIEPPPLPHPTRSAAARFWPHPNRDAPPGLAQPAEEQVAAVRQRSAAETAAKLSWIRFFTWPGVGLLVAAVVLAFALHGTGISWPMFGSGLLMFGVDLALRLRRGGGKALVHPRVGAQVLMVPLMLPGLLFTLGGLVRVLGADYEAMDADLVALRAERASGETGRAQALLAQLEQDLVADCEVETWHARVRQQDGQLLVLVLAPTTDDFTDAARSELLWHLGPEAAHVTAANRTFVGVVDSINRCHGTISPDQGQHAGPQARWRDLLPFYRRQQDALAGRRAIMVFILSCLVAAGLVLSFRRKEPAHAGDRAAD